MSLLVNFIFSVGIFLLALLIGLLVRKKRANPSRIILSIIFLGFLLVTLYSYGEFNQINWLQLIGFPIADSIGFLVGPLLYFYVVSLFNPRKLYFSRMSWHFVPFVLYFLCISIPFLIGLWKDRYIFPFLELLDRHDYLLHIQAIYLLLYALITLKKLKFYQKAVKASYSNLNKRDVKWIYFLLWGIVFLMSFDIVLEIYTLQSYNSLIIGNELITIAMILLVGFLAYFGSNQSAIFLPDFLDQSSHKQMSFARPPNKNHHLANASEEEIDALKTRLMEVLNNDNPYMDEDLTLASLANLIPTSDRKLSALLNHHLNVTFYDLVNSYRVEHVKKRLSASAYQKYTLLAIALEAGFSSKTSFNRIFKKETGVSPSAYKKEQEKK